MLPRWRALSEDGMAAGVPGKRGSGMGAVVGVESLRLTIRVAGGRLAGNFARRRLS
jgi:hypothetical protein